MMDHMQIALRHGRVVLVVAAAAFLLPACAKDSDDHKQKSDVDKRGDRDGADQGEAHVSSTTFFRPEEVVNNDSNESGVVVP